MPQSGARHAAPSTTLPRLSRNRHGPQTRPFLMSRGHFEQGYSAGFSVGFGIQQGWHDALFAAKFLRYAVGGVGRPKATESDRARWRDERKREAYLRTLTDFERELLDAPCPRHTRFACCDQCVAPGCRDSTGFPGVYSANGRGRYRLCSACHKLAGIDQWNFATRSCTSCAPIPEGGAVSPIAKPATLPRLRRITRS
jgi:hypothetical protein